MLCFDFFSSEWARTLTLCWACGALGFSSYNCKTMLKNCFRLPSLLIKISPLRNPFPCMVSTLYHQSAFAKFSSKLHTTKTQQTPPNNQLFSTAQCFWPLRRVQFIWWRLKPECCHLLWAYKPCVRNSRKQFRTSHGWLFSCSKVFLL